MRSIKAADRWLTIAAALIAGFFLLAVDQRTDDTGIEAGMLLGGAFGFTMFAPRAAVAIALALGLPIAAYSVWHGNGAAIAALIFSGVGAGIAYLLRRTTLTPTA